MPFPAASFTFTTGATSSGGGQLPAAAHPLPAGDTGTNTWMRLLCVSATYTAPLQETAIAVGWANSPGPTPRTPHFARNVPSAVNSSTRLFSRSTTNTCPAASTATPVGWWRCPVALPFDPPGGLHGPG